MITEQVKSLLKRTLLLMTIFISACSSELSDYKQSQPAFDLFGYFTGTTHAWGMVQDYTGKQTRRFYVVLNGKVSADILTLTEDFTYDDGETSQRIWIIQRLPDGHYEGKADDIVGSAQGRESGNALRWRYDFMLPRGDSSIKVSFDDWLYRQDEHHVFNRTSIRKWGIEVAELTLFFQKAD